jgi:hypothetical protein
VRRYPRPVIHLRPGPPDHASIATVVATEPGQEVTWGETHVGTRNIFEDAGFTEVARATLPRVVMRTDVDAPASAQQP